MTDTINTIADVRQAFEAASQASRSAMILALATENAELRAALAEAQDLLVETAVDAGEMHARVEGLQAEIVVLQGEGMGRTA